MTTAFCVTKDDDYDWGPESTTPWGYFPDWQTQAFLIPLFYEGKPGLDFFSSAVFSGKDLQLLRANLEKTIKLLKEKPEKWPAKGHLPTSTTDIGSSISYVYRDIALDVTQRCFELTDLAISSEKDIWFLND